MNKNLTIIALSVVIVFLLLGLIKGCNKTSDTTSFVNALTDSLHKERNEKGQEIASIKAFYTSVAENVIALKNSTDSTNKWLAVSLEKASKKNKVLTATVASLQTKDSAASKTKVEFPKPFRPNVRYVWPTYNTSWKDEWSSGSIRATKDSVYREFKVFNKLELNTHVEGGLFQKKTVVSTITNLNPHTETKELRTFETQVSDKFWLKFGIGFGVGAAAAYFIVK